MPPRKITDPTLTKPALNGAEIWPAVQGSADAGITPATLRAYVWGGAGPALRNVAGRAGDFEVWQRGASVAVPASTSAYTCDGWYLITTANQASVVDRVAGLSNGSRYAARVRRNAGQTGTGAIIFAMPLDEWEVALLAGKLFVLSATLKAGANFSPTSGTVTVRAYAGTGASPAKRGGSAYTGEVTVATGTANLTPGGAAVTVQVGGGSTLGTNLGQGELQVVWTPTGTAGAADDITIDDIMLEPIPAAATTWPVVPERRRYGDIWRDCRRHLVVYAPGASGVPVGNGQCYSGTGVLVPVRLDPPMRVTPGSPSISNVAHWQVLAANGSGIGINALTSGVLSAEALSLAPSVAAGLVAGDATQLQTADAAGTITLSAEI